jgi:hypothetical protein
MVLRLIPRSPRRRIRLVTVAGGLMVSRARSGFAKTSADLTPATGARTTRLCRPHPVFANRLRRAFEQAAEVLSKPRTAPSSGARPSLMSKLTLRKHLRARRCRGHRLPRPTSVTIAIRPSCGRGMGVVLGLIWGNHEADYFYMRRGKGLRRRANQFVGVARLSLPSFRGVRSASPESISPQRVRPDGFRARAKRRAPE